MYVWSFIKYFYKELSSIKEDARQGDEHWLLEPYMSWGLEKILCILVYYLVFIEPASLRG